MGDRRLYETRFEGTTYRRCTKAHYIVLVLKRPALFEEGWAPHAWLDDWDQAERQAAKLRKHGWIVRLQDVSSDWRPA